MAASTAAGERVPLRRREHDARTLLIVVLVVALALRVAWAVYAEREPANLDDPFIYLLLARGIAHGYGYLLFFTHDATAFHPVGYPGWLAGIVWVAERTGLEQHEPLVIGLCQALVGTASVALVYAIGARLFDRRIGLLAAALTAVFPSLVVYTGIEYSETLYTFGLLLAVWILVRARWDPMPPVATIVAFGLVVGCSTLVRPFALLLLVALGAAAWRAGARPVAIARALGIVAAITVVLLAPWAVRNAYALHAFVPVSTNLGDTLCLDNSPGAYGGFRQLPPVCDTTVRVPHDEATRNSHNLRYAVRWAAGHPGREAVLVLRRIWYGFRNDHDGVSNLAGAQGSFPPRRTRTLLAWLSDGYYAVVMLLALAGATAFVREPRRLFVLLVAAAIAVVPLLLYGLPRFHVPLLPFAAISAAVGLDRALARRARRGQPA